MRRAHTDSVAFLPLFWRNTLAHIFSQLRQFEIQSRAVDCRLSHQLCVVQAFQCSRRRAVAVRVGRDGGCPGVTTAKKMVGARGGSAFPQNKQPNKHQLIRDTSTNTSQTDQRQQYIHVRNEFVTTRQE